MRLDKAKIEEAFKSFSMITKMNRAAQYFRATGATGVPSIVIDGKYITSSTMAGDNEKALTVADYIIGNIRKDKAKTKAKAKRAMRDMVDAPVGDLAVTRDLAIPGPAGTIPARVYDARESRGAGNSFP